MKKAEQIILRAIDEGVNYFDTAYLYPGSEKVLGTVLAKNNVRDKVYIATKLPVSNCHNEADFDRFFNIQLEALQTDYIDYYLMHNINTMVQWQELCHWGIEEWIEKKKANGKIKQIGFSFHGTKEDFLKVLGAYDWDFCQIQYNYSNENYQAGAEGLKAVAARHIPIIIMEPLLGGKLVNGLSPAAVDVFKKVAPNQSVAAWGLRWLWNQPEVTVILSGMNDLVQLEDNMNIAEKAVSGCLNEAEKEAYRKVQEIFKKTDKVPCTGCAYCMPCPQGVNIPACFASYNASYTHGLVAGFTMYITSTGANRIKNSLASKCVKCGLCETHCPQNIKIRQSLDAVKRRMEPWPFRVAMKFMRGRAR
jgi:predicted aldo/keto reductase-like oxidoreductase